MAQWFTVTKDPVKHTFWYRGIGFSNFWSKKEFIWEIGNILDVNVNKNTVFWWKKNVLKCM